MGNDRLARPGFEYKLLLPIAGLAVELRFDQDGIGGRDKGVLHRIITTPGGRLNVLRVANFGPFCANL